MKLKIKLKMKNINERKIQKSHEIKKKKIQQKNVS